MEYKFIKFVKRCLDILSIIWITLVAFSGIVIYFSGQIQGLYMLSMSLPAIIYLYIRRNYLKTLKAEKKRIKEQKLKEIAEYETEKEIKAIEQKPSVKERKPLKRRIIIIASAAVVLFSIGFYMNYNSYKSIAKRAVKDQLKDPGSAQFSDVEQIGSVVEGTIRAKNGYGGYTVSTFQVIFAEDKTVIATDIK